MVKLEMLMAFGPVFFNAEVDITDPGCRTLVQSPKRSVARPDVSSCIDQHEQGAQGPRGHKYVCCFFLGSWGVKIDVRNV